MTLILDANVAVAACARRGGFEDLRDDLVGPPLMWSEARSTFRLALWRGEVSENRAEQLFDRLEGCPVKRLDPPSLGREAWRVSLEMGWARTYDAEYVALAQLLECRLVTLDSRLRKGADRLGLVVSPDEL